MSYMYVFFPCFLSVFLGLVPLGVRVFESAGNVGFHIDVFAHFEIGCLQLVGHAVDAFVALYFSPS